MMNFAFLRKNGTAAWVKRSGVQSTFAVVAALLVIQTSCEPPFEGVTPILTNNQVDKVISVQVVDANPDSENPYPENPEVTVSGDAIDRGLVFYSDGTPLGDVLELDNNTVNLAIRPHTEIVPGQPLTFNIIAMANGYLSNSISVSVGANDNFKYAELGLVDLSGLPNGVIAKSSLNTDFNENVPSNDIVIDLEDGSSTSDEVLKARLTFKQGTVLKGEDGNELSGDELTTQITYFDGVEDDAILSATGGMGNIVMEDGSIAIINGMVDINAFLNGNKIKSFSNSVTVDIFLSPNSFNPKTGTSYKVGDQVTIISRNNPGDAFINEGTTSLVLDEATQRLKISYNAEHFSVYGIGEIFNRLSGPIDDNPDDRDPVLDFYEYKLRIKSNGQLFASGGEYSHTAQSLLNRLIPNLPDLQTDFDLEIYLYDVLYIKKTFTQGGGISIDDQDIIVNPNAFDQLTFDLETRCSDGTFRYSGPIQYRLSGNKKWLNFSNSVDGVLVTRLLEWGKIYDFRVSYKGETFVRTKEVVKEHFRENANGGFNYWGPDDVKKVFFTAPIGCGE